MPNVKPVGIYREMYRKRPAHLPLLAESYTTRDIEDRSKIIEYMRLGEPVFDVLEDVVDVVDGKEWIRSGPSLISDGEWLWRVDSIYYLSNYALDIPDDFLEHVRSQDYRPSSDIDVSDESFDAAISAYF